MHTKMFVFVGVPNSNQAPTVGELHIRLNQEFSKKNDYLEFSRKDKLLSLRNNAVSFYVSIMESKKEIKDWLQLAKDAEISTDLTPVTETTIEARYNKLRIMQPNRYSETEYSIAMTIFDAIRQFSELDIISFQ